MNLNLIFFSLGENLELYAIFGSANHGWFTILWKVQFKRHTVYFTIKVNIYITYKKHDLTTKSNSKFILIWLSITINNSYLLQWIYLLIIKSFSITFSSLPTQYSLQFEINFKHSHPSIIISI